MITKTDLKFEIFQILYEYYYDEFILNENIILQESDEEKSNIIDFTKYLKNKKFKDNIKEKLDNFADECADKSIDEVLKKLSEEDKKLTSETLESLEKCDKLLDELEKNTEELAKITADDFKHKAGNIVKKEVEDDINKKFGVRVKLEEIKGKFISLDPKYKAVAIIATSLLLALVGVLSVKVYKTVKKKIKEKIEEKRKENNEKKGKS